MKAHLRYLVMVVICFAALPVAPGLGTSDERGVPKLEALLGNIPAALRQYDVIVEPDKNEAEWWAGAPSVAPNPSCTISPVPRTTSKPESASARARKYPTPRSSAFPTRLVSRPEPVTFSHSGKLSARR